MAELGLRRRVKGRELRPGDSEESCGQAGVHDVYLRRPGGSCAERHAPGRQPLHQKQVLDEPDVLLGGRAVDGRPSEASDRSRTCPVRTLRALTTHPPKGDLLVFHGQQCSPLRGHSYVRHGETFAGTFAESRRRLADVAGRR